MAVKIRLRRVGAKKAPFYRVVVILIVTGNCKKQFFLSLTGQTTDSKHLSFFNMKRNIF